MAWVYQFATWLRFLKNPARLKILPESLKVYLRDPVWRDRLLMGLKVTLSRTCLVKDVARMIENAFFTMVLKVFEGWILRTASYFTTWLPNGHQNDSQNGVQIRSQKKWLQMRKAGEQLGDTIEAQRGSICLQL